MSTTTALAPQPPSRLETAYEAAIQRLRGEAKRIQADPNAPADLKDLADSFLEQHGEK